MKRLKFVLAFILVVPTLAFSQSKAVLKHELLISSTKNLTVMFSQTTYKKLRNRKLLVRVWLTSRNQTSFDGILIKQKMEWKNTTTMERC